MEAFALGIGGILGSGLVAALFLGAIIGTPIWAIERLTNDPSALPFKETFLGWAVIGLAVGLFAGLMVAMNVPPSAAPGH